MSSRMGIFVTTVAMAVGLKAAGRLVPALGPITATAKVLGKIDDEMRAAAAESVLDANRLKDGRRPNIVLLTFYNGSQTRADLARYVTKQGGTAWFQTGSNGRVEAFWHHSTAFKPKEAPGCYLGHVVHGSKDGI